MRKNFTPTPEQIKALVDFAGRYGRSWKGKLTAMWIDGKDANEPGGCYLRQIRNQAGPSWLASWRLPKASA